MPQLAELANDALAAATAAEIPLTIAIIDSLITSVHQRSHGGHATGDYVLREFARLGRESVRAGDVLGRWGGEEFLLIMPEAGPRKWPWQLLERLRTLVFGITPSRPSARGLRVSLSAGLAMREKAGALAR